MMGMSAARKLVTYEQIQTGGTVDAPAARPANRPAPKKKAKLGGFVAMGSVWVVVMLLCFSLVQKTAAIRTETADMARMREEIAEIEQANMALEGQIANQSSVAEVEKWARARGMQPPTGLVETLTGKPEAVAVRQSTQPAPEQPQVAKGSDSSFWSSLFARITGSPSQAAGAAH